VSVNQLQAPYDGQMPQSKIDGVYTDTGSNGQRQRPERARSEIHRSPSTTVHRLFEPEFPEGYYLYASFLHRPFNTEQLKKVL
jgi:hypothetical protein